MDRHFALSASNGDSLRSNAAFFTKIDAILLFFVLGRRLIVRAEISGDLETETETRAQLAWRPGTIFLGGKDTMFSLIDN